MIFCETTTYLWKNVVDLKNVSHGKNHTLKDTENNAPRRKHRIEMKFNTRINKNERFT